MISYLEHGQIDKERWDNCISRACNNRIYAFSWYLDIVCNRQWDALVADDYQIVFPLPHRKKGGIRYIYTPFFVQQLGAFSQAPLHTKETDAFLQLIPSQFKLVELALNTCNKAEDSGYNLIENANYELSLNSSYEELRKKYSENLRRNLKKAAVHALQIKADEDLNHIIKLFRSGRGKEISHWRGKQYEVLRTLLEACGKYARLDVRGVHTSEGDCIAGAMILISGGRAIFLFSATGDTAKETGAMPLLLDTFIRENAGSNMILDFEGSNDGQLARFYKGFGAELFSYQRAEKNMLPAWINFIRATLK